MSGACAFFRSCLAGAVGLCYADLSHNKQRETSVALPHEVRLPTHRCLCLRCAAVSGRRPLANPLFKSERPLSVGCGRSIALIANRNFPWNRAFRLLHKLLGVRNIIRASCDPLLSAQRGIQGNPPEINPGYPALPRGSRLIVVVTGLSLHDGRGSAGPPAFPARKADEAIHTSSCQGGLFSRSNIPPRHASGRGQLTTVQTCNHPTRSYSNAAPTREISKSGASLRPLNISLRPTPLPTTRIRRFGPRLARPFCRLPLPPRGHWTNSTPAP